ncbi:hypothetical protein KC853_00840 [Candidatus Saccharibacteria bacterium]|nr:hypothetical protein [Candidatus Saccharibacteria bacterium]MCB9835075.1 hypothetical protein [Candidatus Nomurabacteria bacterium]
MSEFFEENTHRISQNSVKLDDPVAYEMLPDAVPSRRGIFDSFLADFTSFLENESLTSDSAQELKSALDKLSADRLQSIISTYSEEDWTDESQISDVVILFKVLNNIKNVLNMLPDEDKMAATIYSEDTESVVTGCQEAPLTIYTRWLFQDKSLSSRHAFLWESYCEKHLAKLYVIDKEVNIPPEFYNLLSYAYNIYEVAMDKAAEGGDDRSIGVAQILGRLVQSLGSLESSDTRYDYSVRMGIAKEAKDAIRQDNPESLLLILLKYMRPVDIDCAKVSGAVFRPVVIEDSEGNILLQEWQRFDSFWFVNPFEEDEPVSDGSEASYFPNNPQIIRSHSEYDPDGRVTIYKDPSYFRTDGSKVYWGDLSKKDVEKIKGNYYCLSQGDSFYEIPEWAARMVSFIDNKDPNRPTNSFINSLEGQIALPENTVLIDPGYMRAVAIGIITNGGFVPNKRNCTIDFVASASGQYNTFYRTIF